jgi:predicted metal-binding protein
MFGGALVGLMVLGAAGFWAIARSIHKGVEKQSAQAVERFGGTDRVAALVAMVECENCALRDRNRAVWALGQAEAVDALPVLLKHRTGGACHHEREICQREIEKAVELLEARRDGGPFMLRLVRRAHRFVGSGPGARE